LDAQFWQGKRVLVTGANGFVGSNLLPLLNETDAEIVAVNHADYDLEEQSQVRTLLADAKPDIVFHLAGLVGGILANRNRPAEFSYNNLIMGAMMMHECQTMGIQKYITLIGSCSYPGEISTAIHEDDLWKGYPQEESAPYSIAKKMSVVLAQSYRQQYDFDAIVLVPGNIYGPHDNFDLETSHVTPALIKKFLAAKEDNVEEVTAWGTGRPVRDFLYIGDACNAIMKGAESYSDGDIINIASGIPTSIKELVETVADKTGYKGSIIWDKSMPDGQSVKLLNVDRMQNILGFTPAHTLADGIEKTVAWYTKSDD
jgi:GDP-L-fucose synthase